MEGLCYMRYSIRNFCGVLTVVIFVTFLMTFSDHTLFSIVYVPMQCIS